METKKLKTNFSVIGMVILLLTFLVVEAISITTYVLVLRATDNSLVQIVTCLLMSVFLAIAASIIDYARRKKHEEPVDEILRATEEVTRGNLNIKLSPDYRGFDFAEYNSIIVNLNRMIEELSKQEIYKKDFISNLSHEIKTPLAVMQNYATALQNKYLDEEKRREYLQTLVTNCRKITNLVNNILKLNKLENQVILPEKESVNVGEIVRECVLKFEEVIEKKNFDLDIDIDDITVKTDSSMFEIIASNLISNAVKFTDDGGKIAVSLKQNDDEFVLKVTDTGCGMSKDVGKHIFDKFYQGDTSHANEGNGLGLALVKEVVDILDGQIFVSSEIGKGSTFVVLLGAQE